MTLPLTLRSNLFLFFFAASSCETTSSTSSIGNSGSAEETGPLALFSFIVPTLRSREQHSLRETLANNSYFRDGLLLNSKEICGKLVQLFGPLPQRLYGLYAIGVYRIAVLLVFLHIIVTTWRMRDLVKLEPRM